MRAALRWLAIAALVAARGSAAQDSPDSQRKNDAARSQRLAAQKSALEAELAATEKYPQRDAFFAKLMAIVDRVGDDEIGAPAVPVADGTVPFRTLRRPWMWQTPAAGRTLPRAVDVELGNHPFAAIVDLDHQLAARGVDLLLVTFPSRIELYPELLDLPEVEAFGGMWDGTLRFLLALNAAGVETLSLGATFAAQRFAASGRADQLFLRFDPHWTPRGAELAARLVGERIGQLPWFVHGPASEGHGFRLQDDAFVHDSFANLSAAASEPESVHATEVMNGSAPVKAVSRTSPLLVVGDSFVQIHGTHGADFCSQLLRFTGHAVDAIGVPYGAELMCRQSLAQRGAEQWVGKKLVVWLLPDQSLGVSEKWAPLAIFGAATAAAPTSVPPPDPSIATVDSACEKDVAFALDALEKKCGHFFELKKIDWKKVATEMTLAAKQAKNSSEHLRVLKQLLARLKDGHAEVRPLDKGKDVLLPAELRVERGGPGLFFCRIGDALFVKNSFGPAEKEGIKPGVQVVKINGKPALDWIANRVAELRDLESFSTEQQAFFVACHQGLALSKGTKLEFELEDRRAKKLTRSVTCGDANQTPWGPAFFPDKLQSTNDLNYAKTAGGFGYLHVRRSPADLPQQLDVALAALGKVPGMILDFRGNSGGGFDHEGFMGRFVPANKKLTKGTIYTSAGKNPYGGPIVVIVDATVRSAGETAAGIFKEDGRAYMIGESPTAGMSSQKETIDLPSGLFSLYVGVATNKGRFNEGRGVEGIGVVPHEIVPFDPKDLEKGVDTLIARAEAIFKKFPQEQVDYDPKKFGWK